MCFAFRNPGFNPLNYTLGVAPSTIECYPRNKCKKFIFIYYVTFIWHCSKRINLFGPTKIHELFAIIYYYYFCRKRNKIQEKKVFPRLNRKGVELGFDSEHGEG